MRRKKPAGWPRFMRAKALKSGATAYFWEVPSAYPKCGVDSEALGTDYAIAKARCDEKLNPAFEAWRMGSEAPTQGTAAPGTFDWLVAQYQKSPQYRRIAPKTQKDYDQGLAMVQNHVLKDGRKFGDLKLTSITPTAADRLYEKLKTNKNGELRVSMANAAMRYCRRAWTIAFRAHPKIVPSDNPFSKMGLEGVMGGNEAATRAQLEAFAAEAIAQGWASVAVAAYITFEWHQREVDIVERIGWGYYRPAERPASVQIRHPKTGVWFWSPLEAWDDETSAHVLLYPELETMLSTLPRRGSLIVMRDVADARKEVHLPWNEHTFRHLVRKIMDDAGLPKSLSFTSFRHGGMTELGDSDLTDSQIMSLSGHKDPKTLRIYNKSTEVKREAGALMRLKSRTARATRAQNPVPKGALSD